MTRLCITSTGPTLDSQLDPRFGRCAYFIFVDSETLQFDAIPNDAAMAAGGAGIRAAQTVVSRGAEVVITGSVGPNAFPALQNSGIRILTTVGGTVRDAIERYRQGSLVDAASAGPAYAGAGYGMGRGMGRGM
ncbi:MAG TPA: dinitrogenase iron-molybdenum cofactor biosynthesis protein, partial [Candidatus Thorarchaeota archaeon]|nr:dinitrogenase iron-molybdenum cofactor biosynthesis protein [Candidatus Thorarchaeota archaeon]